jgi:tripeptide aminopeptidase
MAEQFKGIEFLIDYGSRGQREVGIEPASWQYVGTDGAQLTFRGLPCPNIATGGYNALSFASSFR